MDIVAPDQSGWPSADDIAAPIVMKHSGSAQPAMSAWNEDLTESDPPAWKVSKARFGRAVSIRR